MATIVTVTNQKGGAGKTTTAQALAAGLIARGQKVLVVDLDSQGNFSFTAGADSSKPTVLGLLTGEAKTEDTIQHLANYSLIPSSAALSGADGFITETGKEYRLKEALEAVQDSYNYIVIDTPPALGILTVNALTACKYVVIPAQADIYSLQGIEQLSKTIDLIKRYCNQKLEIAGILLTRYNSRSILSQDVAKLIGQLAEKLGTKVYKATIRENIAIKEAQISRKDIFQYAPKSKAAEDYNAFINEFLADSSTSSADVLERLRAAQRMAQREQEI